MPELRPFRGIHFDFERRPDLDGVLAPPYDVLDPETRDELEAGDPWNAVRLELPAEHPGDGPAENRFTRSARWLHEWLAQGVLVRDARPCLYALRTTFDLGGRRLVRRGFLAAARLEPSARVLPHEDAREEPIRERLELLRATRLDTSPVLLLHDVAEVDGMLAPLIQRPPEAWGRDPDGAHHDLWRIDDERAIAGVVAAMAAGPAVIGDGHHRWETGRRWARECGILGEPEGPQAFQLACFVSFSDPGLATLATHRVISSRLPAPGLLAQLLGAHFDVEELPEDPRRPPGLLWILRRLADASGHAFVLVTAADARARLCVLRQGVDLAHVHALPRNPTLRGVDVVLLHSLLMEDVLGLAPAEQEERVGHEQDPAQAIARAFAEKGAAALLNPTPPWQVRAVAAAGERMPAKSTYFFPKVPAGLAFLSVDPKGV